MIEKLISKTSLRSFSVLMFFLLLFQLRAQKAFEIVIISDAAAQENHFFEGLIKSEITALLGSQYELTFREIYTNKDVANINEEITKVYARNQADVIVGVGIISSKVLAAQRVFPIPTIASVKLLDDTTVDSEVSNISNYTYIDSPFSIQAGIAALQEICQGEKIAVVTDIDLTALGVRPEDIYSSDDVEISWLSFDVDLSATVAKIPDDVEGVYVLSPLSGYSAGEVQQFFGELIERKLPSFTLLDVPMLSQGAYASFVASDNLKKIPRRIARNIEQIAVGKDPKDLSVRMEAFTNQLVVNMETVNEIGKYPRWSILDNALLININQPSTDRVINLKSVIIEAIQNNLGYQIESQQTQISAKDVDLAKSNYLPQLSVETTGFFVDENTVNSSFGTLGSFNWTAGASFSQLILSEPALANVAIQKLLFESQQQAQKQSELDVILEVAQRYFGYMQIRTVAELQNDNIKAVNQNLLIAKNKETIGYGGSSDVYRWQIELDLAKTDLYTTNAQLKSAGYQLNESLNLPINEVFTVDSSENIDQFIADLDQIFLSLIQDQASFEQLANFMVDEARQNLPEIEQIELAIAAQERLLKSNKRSFYLPTVAFVAGYDYPVSTVNPGEPLPIPGVEIENLPTWNAAINVSLPLFAGGSRKFEKERTEVGLYQLQNQQRDVTNLLELQVRANMELVNAAYNGIRLTKSAALAAGKNIEIVRDLYQSGQVDIITLVDAQNALLGAQINATNAVYQFMIDYFSLQRSIGSYAYLATDEQRGQFLQRFLNYKSN